MALFIDQAVVVPNGTYKECDMGTECVLIRIVNNDPANTLEYSLDGTNKAGQVLFGDVDHVGGVPGNQWRKVWIKMAAGSLYFVQGTPAR